MPAIPPQRIYRTWVADSRRWDHYQPRDGDIVIATYPKCGTTWMQQIVSLLVHRSPEPRELPHQAAWIERRYPLAVADMERLWHNRHDRCKAALTSRTWAGASVSSAATCSARRLSVRWLRSAVISIFHKCAVLDYVHCGNRKNRSSPRRAKRA